MKKQKSIPKKTMYFCFLCCLVYFTSYLTRIDYAAVLVEIIEDLGITKSAASIAVTGSFITYGLGQLVSGYLGDKIAPRTLIAAGLCCTSATNLLMSVLPNITVMTVFWCFNGFFQAMLWPPLVRIMAENLDENTYSTASVSVSAAASVATIAVYLLSPLVILLSGWKLVFLICGSAGFITVILWLAGTRTLSPGASEKPVNPGSGAQTGAVSGKVLARSGIFIIMTGIILQGILRDGISTWMPTYISEVFDLGTHVSILTAVILPVFSIMSVSIGSAIQKKIGNEVKTAAILYGVSALSALIIIPFFSSSMIVSALMMAIITGAMHGVNLMLISRLPVHFKRYGKVSTISGILNACTYVGSALSTYGFAHLSEAFGWYFIIISWAVIALLGTSVCAVCIRRWEAFRDH
ncbi:MAG: MFS transporter [Clostridia bacterium]|nr:MFS transporter [Clostridia bacterium]